MTSMAMALCIRILRYTKSFFKQYAERILNVKYVSIFVPTLTGQYNILQANTMSTHYYASAIPLSDWETILDCPQDVIAE